MLRDNIDMVGMVDMAGMSDWIGPIIVVLCVILSNIGARYILIDLDRKHGHIFGHPKMVYLYIFCMSYLGSRDPLLSLMMSLCYSLV